MRNRSSMKVGGRHSVLQLACWTQDLRRQVQMFCLQCNAMQCIGGGRDIDLDEDGVDHNTYPIISMAVEPLK